MVEYQGNIVFIEDIKLKYSLILARYHHVLGKLWRKSEVFADVFGHWPGFVVHLLVDQLEVIKLLYNIMNNTRGL
jgi:hypothetical protein